jgi:hypothetical protein
MISSARRVSLLLLLLTAPGAAGEPCAPVTLEGDSAKTAEIAARLEARTIRAAPAEPGCDPLRARVQARADGALGVTLALGRGTARTLATADDAAIWIASWVGEARYADLLEKPPAPPELPAPAAEPPAPPTDQRLALYATLEDLRRGQPTGHADAALRPLREAEAAGLPPVVSLDLTLRAAKPLTKTYAIAAGDTIYINPEAPLPARSATYGQLQRQGDAGLFPQRVCYWISTADGGHIQCELRVYEIDLQTGAVERVTWPRLKRAGVVEPSTERRGGIGGLWEAALAAQPVLP